jgi:hypothetical protein
MKPDYNRQGFYRHLIAAVVIMILYQGIGPFTLHKATFIPFGHDSSIDVTTSQWVTLPDYYTNLKWLYPTIREIDTIDAMQPTDVAILPWSFMYPGLQPLPLNDTLFYNDPAGTISFQQWQRESDMYDDFMAKKTQITIGGTVVLARGVHTVIQNNNDPLFPFGNTASLFKKSDISIINLKSPLIHNFEKPSNPFTLVGPAIYANALSEIGITIAAIAGNHMGDAGTAGFEETLHHLQANGIQTVGGGASHADAYACRVIDHNGNRFGFLAFNNVWSTIDKATHATPGIAWLDEDALTAISACQSTVDMVIVMVNWGIEYTHAPRDIEREWAYKMANAGATLILGDQAHWVQQHETINTTHVSYGLGNYIFDQHWSEKTRQGIIQTVVVYNHRIIVRDTIPIELQPSGAVSRVPRGSSTYTNIMSAYNEPVAPTPK